jgi:hypothetical protein
MRQARGKAIHRVAAQSISPEEAVDEAIARIKQILSKELRRTTFGAGCGRDPSTGEARGFVESCCSPPASWSPPWNAY